MTLIKSQLAKSAFLGLISLAAGSAVADHAVSSPVDEPYRWKSVAIVAGGFISGIDFHPGERGLVYCRTDIGGAYRWDGHEHRWIPLLDWLTKPNWNLYGIESIGLDPSDPKRLYLACGTYTNEWGGNGAILRSEDQGRTFQRTNLPFKNGGNEDGRSMGERLAVDPNDGRVLFFGSRNNGLWFSTDRGATWTLSGSFPVKGRTNGIGTAIVVFDPRSGSKNHPSKVIYAFVADNQGGVYRTTDGGTTWSKVPGQPTGFMAHHAVLTHDGDLYITFSNGPGPNGITDGAVYKLSTSNNVWTDITPVKPEAGHTGGYAGLSVDLRHPETLVVSTLDHWSPGDDVFRSTDGGKSWHGMREKSTRDSSLAPYMTWGAKEASFGWWTGALAMDPSDNAHVMYGTGANIWTSDNVTDNGIANGTKWTVGGLGIEETADIDLLSPATGPHLISALGDIGGFTHNDLDKPAPGMTLNPMLSNTDGLDYAESAPSLIVRVGRPDHNERRAGYSTNAGETWQPFATDPPAGRGSGSIAITADGKTILWAPNGAEPYLTHDLGATWIAATGCPRGARIVTDRVNPSKVYALSDGSVFISTDGGQTFAAGATNLPTKAGILRAPLGVEGDLWLPTDGGLYRSIDSGASFNRVMSVDQAEAVGFGKAAPGQNYPAIFLNGEVSGIYGVFRSDDGGGTWLRISDAQHEYGVRGVIIGDPRIFGRVYMGSNGRGVFYGDPVRPVKPSK